MKPDIPKKTLSSDPIFILGISQRSGTNFLSNLIRQHPQCGAPATIWEDCFTCYSDLLLEYTQTVFSKWKWKSGSANKALEVQLNHALGSSLINFLSSEIQAERLVTKTPDVTNVSHHFDLFPNSFLIILIRDGRAVVESRVKTFNESYQTAMWKWSTAADLVLEFDKIGKNNNGRYLIVKYEDLWNDVEYELRKIFDFCRLDPNQYDFNSAKNQPIRGSSVYYGEKHSDVHWQPVKKTNDFDPTERWSHWSRSLHEQFITISGKNLHKLGYEPKHFKQNSFYWILFRLTLNLHVRIFYPIMTIRHRIKKNIRCYMEKCIH